MNTQQKAIYLNNQWTWFDYQETEKNEALKELLSFPKQRIDEAYDWYVSQNYDYMAYGEYLRHAIDYIKGKVDNLW